MATSLLEALQQQRVTKHPGILFFLIQRSKRRLAGRKDVKFIQKLANCSKKGVIHEFEFYEFNWGGFYLPKITQWVLNFC